MATLPLWAWIVFYILVFIMLIIDLKMFSKKGEHEVSVSEALKMTGVCTPATHTRKQWNFWLAT